MKGRRKVGIGGFLLLALPLGAGNPAGAQGGPVLTLGQALTLAEEHNPGYLTAQNNLELSGAERLLAWGAFLPSFSFNTGTGVNLNRQLIATDNFGNPIENPITDWRTSSSSSQSLNGRISLWQWGARSRGLATQRARARSREASLTSSSRSLRATVTRLYRAAQNQQALQAVEEDLLASRGLDLETTRRMFELAGASRVDVLTAELAVQEQEQRIQQARGELQTALLSLRTAVGDEDLIGFRVEEVLPAPFDPGALDADAVTARALDASPTLIEQETNVNLARAELSSARGDRWPPLSLSFSASQSAYGDQLTGALDPYPDRSRSGGASFGISIPLFPRFDYHASIVQSEVGFANAQERLRQTRLQVEEQVRGRLISLQTAYQGYLIALRSREIAQERLTLGREQFRLGSRTFTELQQDIDAAARAERSVINQLFALELALTNLEEVVGEELR